jgi:hypothetical protein
MGGPCSWDTEREKRGQEQQKSQPDSTLETLKHGCVDPVSGFYVYGEEGERLKARLNEQPKADSAQAAEILTKSAELLVERGKRYDKADGTSSMDRAVAAFNEITGHNLSEADGWMLMLMLKLSRATAKAGYHADSYEDSAAFVGLMAVAKRKQEEGM